MVSLKQLDADQFALGAGNRLGRNGGQPGDQLKPLLNFKQYFQRALGIFKGRLRMQIGKAGLVCRPIVEVGVVFYGARSQWVAAIIRAHIEIAEAPVVVLDLCDRKFRQSSRFLTQQVGRDWGYREIVLP